MNEKMAVLRGVFWKFAERLAAQLVSLVVSVILARLLSPSEYGIIAIVTVFTAIANAFVTESFGAALIQKQDTDALDYSSVFYFTLGLTFLLYLILFFLAIPISKFYEIPLLKPVLRVLALSLPILGINSIQQAYISRKMEFKKFFQATIIGTIISAVVGIVMAFCGFGVWALVAQSLTNNVVDTIILQLSIEWKPARAFSMERIRSLLSYGWKLVVQNLIFQVYGNLRSLLIGKIYTTSDLAYYTKGNYLPNLLSTNIDTAINTALFPAMSRAQESIQTVKNMARKTTQMTSYVMNPVLVGFMAIAVPFIHVLLTDKWLPAVPFLRIQCVILLFRAPQTAILQAMKAVGKSDTILKCDVPLRIFAICVLLVSIRFGVLCFAFSEILVTVVCTVLYAVAAKRIIGYTGLEICGDFISNVARAAAMGIATWYLGNILPFNAFVTMLIQIVFGFACYMLISVVTRSKELGYLVKLICECLQSRRGPSET